jgi:SecD/SecF fusion protein
VAADMQEKAVMAILLSLLGIVIYLWIRFQRVAYGLAAVIAVIHDVLITLGVVALSYWLSGALGFLLVENFKISLAVIAAFLTIIGYSLNDTIVTFDRIREIRGKSPHINMGMVNDSVNQTLSRTLLTAGTTLATIVVLYMVGGQGIRGFAFAMLVGVVVGTYSSVYIAAPVLLWLTEGGKKAPAQQPVGEKLGAAPVERR